MLNHTILPPPNVYIRNINHKFTLSYPFFPRKPAVAAGCPLHSHMKLLQKLCSPHSAIPSLHGQALAGSRVTLWRAKSCRCCVPGPCPRGTAPHPRCRGSVPAVPLAPQRCPQPAVPPGPCPYLGGQAEQDGHQRQRRAQQHHEPPHAPRLLHQRPQRRHPAPIAAPRAALPLYPPGMALPVGGTPTPTPPTPPSPSAPHRYTASIP